jgi:uncharacterized protein (TIGR04222 family)
MKPQHVELWERLEQFQLDSPEATLPFSIRLARENNWSAAYTQRVVAEYKRFAFLAVAAGHPVSPAEDVDQAWHLHLTYTQSYWKVFCPQVLQAPLHHQPTQGGEAERDKFEDWYRRTLESYREHFGEEPPNDIWPSPEAKRAARQEFIRVGQHANWIIPKPDWRLSPKFAAFTGLLVLAALCTGAVRTAGVNPFNWTGPVFLGFYLMLCVVCLTTAFLLRRALRLPEHAPGNVEPELDGYALAYLNGGRLLTVNAAIANLANQNLVWFKGRNRIEATRERLESGHQLERVVHAVARGAGGASLNDVRLASKPIVAGIMEALKARGLVVTDAQALKAILLPLLIALVLPVVGGLKIAIGLSRGRPVSFLVMLTIVATVISLLAFARRPLRSRWGDAVLKRLQGQHTALRQLDRNTSNLAPAAFATAIGLFGLTALAGTQLDDVRKSLRTSYDSGNGSSCGSSCGGGGDGGGCGGGGCGGCGGGGD